jgi:tetratricopeptide (TPR) repeat protein
LIAEAERLIENASIHDNRSAKVPYIKGNIASARGRFSEARSYYSEAISINPEHSRAYLNRIACAMAMDEAHLALDDCNILLEKAPELHLVRLRRAESWMHLAEWPEAISDLEEVLSRNPRHSHALTKLASCYIATGRPELAETPLNEALRIEGDNAGAWYQRGLLYMEWDRTEAALADFQKAAKAEHTHLDSRLHIAAIHHGAGRWDEALMAWKEVLELEPENEVARRRHDQSEAYIAAPIINLED